MPANIIQTKTTPNEYWGKSHHPTKVSGGHEAMTKAWTQHLSKKARRSRLVSRSRYEALVEHLQRMDPYGAHSCFPIGMTETDGTRFVAFWGTPGVNNRDYAWVPHPAERITLVD